MIDDTVYEPLKQFESEYKEKVNEEAINTYENLLKESKIDINQNEMSVKKYNETVAKNEKVKDKLTRYKVYRALLYILAAISFIVAIIFFVRGFTTVNIVVGVLLITLGALFIVLNVVRINKIIKHDSEIKAALDQQVKQLYDECLGQVRPLINLFDFNMASKIIEKAVPMIKLDDYFKNDRLQSLISHYGYKVRNYNNESTVLVQSGTLNTNPFIFVKNRVQDMVNMPFVGTKIITWVETETDSDGKTRTVTKSQTLTATIYKPVPRYQDLTYLVYGNEAASNLSFTRTPTRLFNPSEKEVEKYINKREKKLENLAEDAVSEGKRFTPIANTEFECLFGALDRNHEVEFRLLFTPLAQNNMVDLITKNKYYGDDFVFSKEGPINYIRTDHIQNFDLSQSIGTFLSHDQMIIREKFINYINDYFKNIYFDLAPLLSIPLYQQHTMTGSIYDNTLMSNYTLYEQEVMANKLSSAIFTPEGARTESILKVVNSKKVGNADLVTIRAFAFDSVQRVEYVSVFGGDGRSHNVPVFYDEYFPISRDEDIVIDHFVTDRQVAEVKADNISEYLTKTRNLRDLAYKNGLVTFVTDSFDKNDDEVLNKILNK